MLQRLTFSILVKWSPFTKSPLHLSALIAHVCLPYNSLRTPLADIVADIERLTIMSPCFTLLLKLRCVMFYWHCSPGCASLFLSTVFECHSLSTRPHASSVYYITSYQVVFKCGSDWYLSRFFFPPDIFSDLCTAALSDSDETEASTWGEVSQDSR